MATKKAVKKVTLGSPIIKIEKVFVNDSSRILELGFTEEQIRLKDFPIIPNGDRVIVRAVEAKELIHEKSGLIMIEGKDNQSKLCTVMSISPELFNKARHPMMFLKPNDICYFNHNQGNYMRLNYKEEMGEYYVMYIMDIMALFTGDKMKYFGRDITEPITEKKILESVGAFEIGKKPPGNKIILD